MNNGKICVSVCGSTLEETLSQIRRADEVADVIEIRFDCLSKCELDLRDTEKARAALRHILSERHRSPVLATFRPQEQGGMQYLSKEERIAFWNSIEGGTWADLEEDMIATASRPAGEMMICSYHDFSGVPKDLDEIAARLRNTGADVTKIAVQAVDILDTIHIWKLLREAVSAGYRSILIAMGEAGKWTRILGPANGSFMTYAALESGSETAPGQITAEDLINVYRVTELDETTEVYGLIAGDTSYSSSPYMHNAAFRSRELNSVFVPLQVRDLDGFMRRMVIPGTREIDVNFKGFSVTNPHKQAIMKYLDRIDETAKKIGAVNTVRFENGELLGYNTDASGFVEPLKRKFGDLTGLRIAVAGAGGAARACVFALKNAGAQVCVLARDISKAESLAAEFEVGFARLPGADVQRLAAWPVFDIIVNATPLGTKGPRQNESIAGVEQLKSVKLVYDLTYNPAETRLIREARQAGAATIGGLDMLIAQGALQFEIWTGEPAPVEEMTAAVKKRLNL